MSRRSKWPLTHAPIPDGPVAGPTLSDRLFAQIEERDSKIDDLLTRLGELKKIDREVLLQAERRVEDAAVRDVLTDVRARLTVALKGL